MDYEVLDNGQVLKVVVGDTYTEKIHHCMNSKIEASINGTVVTLSLQDWQGNPLPYEPIPFTITGDYEGSSVCDDGMIELDGVTGTVVVKTALASVDNTEIEVTL